jgi:hypothetical protein
MTEAVATGGTPNPTGATPTNNGVAPEGETLLTNGTPAAAEAKPGEANQAPDGSAKEGEGKADDKGTPAVPEKYEFKMPEGVELDTAAAEEFSVLAKELKLDNATAQRVADIAVKMQQKQAEQQAATVKGWADSSKADKEFGGDNLKQNLSVAQKAIDTFGSSELKEMLKTTGLGNHPEIIRFAFKAGTAISEDGFVRAGSRAPTPAASLEKKLYPNMN